MEFIFIGLLLGVFIWFGSKISRLEADVTSLKKQVGLGGVTQKPAPQNLYQDTQSLGQFAPAGMTRPASVIPRAEAIGTPAYRPPESNQFLDWLKEDILLKIGALFLLMGFGWFVSYAFANNWIGPVGRISLGLFAGLLVTGIGTWRIAAYRHQGAVFLVLGSGVVLLTVFAARELYEFLTPAVALMIMFLSVAYVATMSVVYSSERLALAGLVMAAVAPLLTNTPEPSVFALMSYLLVIVLGTLWVVRLTGSHLLTFATVIMMILYSLPFVGGQFTEADNTVALFFAFIFGMIFFITNTISVVMDQTDSARKVQMYTAAGTGLYLAMWIVAVVSDTMQSLAFVFWMVVFSVGSFLVYTQTENKLPFYIYGALTIGFLFAATAAELSGPTLTLAYTAQVAVLLIAARLTLTAKISDGLVWLFALPVALSLESFISNSWNSGVLHDDFIVLLTVAGALALVGLVYLQTRVVSVTAQKPSVVAELLLGTSFLYVLALIWLVIHASIAGDTATTITLIIYTIIGLGFWVAGQVQHNKFMAGAGAVLLGAVVLRLLTVDVWQMDLIGRIVTFLAVGVLLISTAFIKKSKSSSDSNHINYE